MFFLAILFGIYGYGIFALGIFGLLSVWPIALWTLLVGSTGFWYGIRYPEFISGSKGILKQVQNDSKIALTLVLLILLAIVNLIGVLGPETSFDALWYHLTFPKLYLETHLITFIPGGLLYYSAMPKLGELLFIPALAFGNEILAKGIQYVFGILTTIVVFTIARRYVSFPLSLLASLIFYSNIVVAWESTVAYIDLIRAFYETMALWALFLWMDTKKKAWLYLSAVMLGFAISTKLLALGSLLIFTILIVYISLRTRPWKIERCITTILVYWFLSFLIPLPWFIFSYIYTGNPVYPFFTTVYPIGSAQSIFSLPTFFSDFGNLFLFAADPISPIYLIVLPLVFIYFIKLKYSAKMLLYYSFFALLFWYITPRTGGGRFILPYLPAFSLLVILLLDQLKANRIVYKTIIISIFFIAILTILYRGIANSRYIPVIVGTQSKEQFLMQSLNFSYGDFYDTDGYFRTHIKESDRVLLYGFHNLYYVDFPFVHETWIKKGERFTHIATQGVSVPDRFSDWQLIYENKHTSVRLYTKGKTVWHY